MSIPSLQRSVLLCALAAVLLVFPGGCATGERKESAFTYLAHTDGKFPARSQEPAEIVNEADASLLKRGYAPIGMIEVKHRAGHVYETDPTSAARSLASRHGGEVVTLAADNERREDVELIRGKCLETRTRRVLVWSPYEAYDRWQDVGECVAWEQIPVKKPVIVTRATVWRYDPEFLARDSWKLLSGAVQDGRIPFAMTLLESIPVDVNAADRFGWTALMYAAHYGGPEQTAMARILLANGANVNAADGAGKTALMRAALNGHSAMARLLLEHGADVHAKDRAGRTVLDHAKEPLRSELLAWIEEREGR